MKMQAPKGFIEDYPHLWNSDLEKKYRLSKSQVKYLGIIHKLKKSEALLITRATMGGLKSSNRHDEDHTGYRKILTGNVIKKQGNVTRHRMGK